MAAKFHRQASNQCLRCNLFTKIEAEKYHSLSNVGYVMKVPRELHLAFCSPVWNECFSWLFSSWRKYLFIITFLSALSEDVPLFSGCYSIGKSYLSSGLSKTNRIFLYTNVLFDDIWYAEMVISLSYLYTKYFKQTILSIINLFSLDFSLCMYVFLFLFCNWIKYWIILWLYCICFAVVLSSNNNWYNIQHMSTLSPKPNKLSVFSLQMRHFCVAKWCNVPATLPYQLQMICPFLKRIYYFCQNGKKPLC